MRAHPAVRDRHRRLPQSRADVESLLAGARPIAPAVLELRRRHARALSVAIAQRCVDLAAADRQPSLSLADLPERARDATWTTPELAFAYYVQLRADDIAEQVLPNTISALLDTCAADPPPPDIRGDDTLAEWKGFGLESLMADYRRDGRSLAISHRTPTAADVERVEAAREILGTTWPDMAATVDALVRELVWYDGRRGAASGTLIQTYGAVFVASGRAYWEALEVLVHESTHLELIARFAVDKALLNPRERDHSPFRQRPRPLSRVLHAAVVAARVAEACDRSLDWLPAAERDRASIMRRRCTTSLDEALVSLERSGQWTSPGARLLDDLTKRANELLRAPA